MNTWHLTFASDGRSPLFPEEVARRKSVRALARVGGTSAVLYNLVDDHSWRRLRLRHALRGAETSPDASRDERAIGRAQPLRRLDSSRVPVVHCGPKRSIADRRIAKGRGPVRWGPGS